MGDNKDKWKDLGMGLAGQAGGGIIGAGLGLMLEGHNDRRQLKQEEKLQAMQMRGAKEMALFNYDQQMKMWDATNYKAQMDQLRKAGLNPGLIYGMSGGGGATAQAAQAAGPSSGAGPKGGGEAMGMMMQGTQTAAQVELLRAQKENIEADTANKLGDAGNKPKVGANIEADTENKILDSVIKEYTGKEIKSEFENVREPNRGVEADTYQKELEGRGGIAQNIYELWTEGKLKDKSNADVEQALLSNAKTREETRMIIKSMDLLEENIKGAKISNIIGDLEARLQTATGIDKSSAGWLKILGRLWINLTGR